MKSARRTQNGHPLRLALFIGGTAGNLDRSFGGFSTRITEKHLIKTRKRGQHFGNNLLTGNPVQIGRMP